MDPRFPRILNIILGSLLFLAIIFVIIFGVRLASINKIKAAELQANVTKREQEVQKACQLDKERTQTTFTADEVFGNFQFSYPKTWETNFVQKDGDTQLQFLADPELIRMENENGPATALRVIVYGDSFTSKANNYDSMESNNSKTFAVEELTLSGLKGRKYTGSTPETQGRIISFALLPLRDKTLYIGTDDYTKYNKQFETILNSFKASK